MLILRTFILFFIKEKRSIYINRFSFFSKVLAVFVNIGFYWFAAKAYSPSTQLIEKNQINLFEFILTGEIILALTLDSITYYSEHLKQILREGVFEVLLTSRKKLWISLSLLTKSSLVHSLLLYMINAGVVFFLISESISFIGVAKFLLLQIISFPCFLGLGLMSAALLVIFKRGSGVIGTFVGLIGISSGVYFPTSFLPSFVEKINMVSPFYWFIKESRLLIFNNTTDINYLLILVISAIIGLISFLLSILIFDLSLKYYKRAKNPFILGT
tara:strand:+ start:39862 stop:40677 length:816 start_codon:yes stop_codon:yes gene_type:complete